MMSSEINSFINDKTRLLITVLVLLFLAALHGALGAKDSDKTTIEPHVLSSGDTYKITRKQTTVATSKVVLPSSNVNTTIESTIYNEDNMGDNYSISRTDDPDFLSPKNISSIFKGSWNRESGTLYGSTKSSGEITMNLKSSETILKEFHFVEGEVGIRDGIYIHDKYWTFLLQGVYSIYTGNLFFYLKPPGLLFAKLKGTQAKFNDTGAQLAFELAMKHRDVKKLRELQQAQLQQQQFMNNVLLTQPVGDSPSEQELLLLQQQQQQRLYGSGNVDFDPMNTCIYKGVFKVRTIKPINWEEEDDDNIIVRDHYEEEQALFQAQMQNLDTDEPSKQNSAAADQRQRLVKMAMTGQIVALNCNSTIQVSEMMTFSVETVYNKAIHYTLMINMLIIAQTCALIYQMSFTRTQSGASRVSLLTIGQQAMIDSYLCLLHLTFGVVFSGAFNAFAAAAFLYFVLFSVFEMRYLLIIWKARRPQAFANGWQTMRRELQILYTRFYGVLIIGLFVMYQLHFLFKYLLFIVSSFWLPQIFCNITRNARKSLHPIYIIIASVSRLSIPIYLFACPNNFLSSEPNITLVLYLSGWVSAQVLVLMLQYFYGPRFMLPRFFAPSRYQYRRTIPDEILEDGECQCVICMNPVMSKNSIELEEVTVTDTSKIRSSEDMSDDQKEVSGKAHNMSNIMVTPCNHAFHAECLSTWLDYKMECPTCRKSLPEL